MIIVTIGLATSLANSCGIFLQEMEGSVENISRSLCDVS